MTARNIASRGSDDGGEGGVGAVVVGCEWGVVRMWGGGGVRVWLGWGWCVVGVE